jgi:hypothetical protein
VAANIAKKRGGGICFLCYICSHKFHKIKNNSFFEQVQKKI